jgi:hypothetical protein
MEARARRIRHGGKSSSQRAVPEEYNTISESAFIDELEVGARVGRESRLSPTKESGPDVQLALVNQPGLECMGREVRTP